MHPDEFCFKIEEILYTRQLFEPAIVVLAQPSNDQNILKGLTPPSPFFSNYGEQKSI